MNGSDEPHPMNWIQDEAKNNEIQGLDLDDDDEEEEDEEVKVFVLKQLEDSGVFNQDISKIVYEYLGNGFVLIASDGSRFYCSRAAVKMSGVLHTMGHPGHNPSFNNEIKVDCRPQALQQLIKYMEYHKSVDSPEIQKPLSSADLSEVLPAWDFLFVQGLAAKVDETTLLPTSSSSSSESSTSSSSSSSSSHSHHNSQSSGSEPKRPKLTAVPEPSLMVTSGFQDVVFELMLVANFLNIPSLLDLMCAVVATLIKGKTPEQIRETFSIENNFTPEEEEAVRQENRWAEES